MNEFSIKKKKGSAEGRVANLMNFGMNELRIKKKGTAEDPVTKLLTNDKHY